MVACATIRPRLPLADIEAVLAVGGMKGYAHLGALEQMDAERVPLGIITGGSAGALDAAFYTNGYAPREIAEIFIKGLQERKDPLLGALMAASGLTPADPLNLMLGSVFDLNPYMRSLVKTYDLKPNKKLRIVATDMLTRTPVVFEGTDYDLAHALTASCALHDLFRLVWDFGKWRKLMDKLGYIPSIAKDHDESLDYPQLFRNWYDLAAALCNPGNWPTLVGDCAYYSYNPPDFCKGPAIFSTFGRMKRMPENASPLGLYVSWRELYLPMAPSSRYVDSWKNLVIEHDLPDVAALNFDIEPAKCWEIFEIGRETTRRVLSEARSLGRFSHEDSCPGTA